MIGVDRVQLTLFIVTPETKYGKIADQLDPLALAPSRIKGVGLFIGLFGVAVQTFLVNDLTGSIQLVMGVKHLILILIMTLKTDCCSGKKRINP